jgi:hypothetical protein
LGVGSKGSFVCYIESLKPFFVLSQNISCNPAKQKKSVKCKLQDSGEEQSKRELEKATVGQEEIQDFRNLGILDSDKSRRARRIIGTQEFGNSGFG